MDRPLRTIQQQDIDSLDSEARRFRRQLVAALEEDPIEDGVSHPAERLIEQAFCDDADRARGWLSDALSAISPVRPGTAASLLRCIGRIDYAQTGAWGLGVAADALRHGDPEVRDAAIRALESWGGNDCLVMLRGHHDPEAWLRSYVEQVTLDLSAATP
ncbi:MAG: hypothetical protein C4547_03960 [Phycisphaerales bacterium]|nr:MAG: hypothetical protein C4547_03960 [Phycisphaerales bacterium]